MTVFECQSVVCLQPQDRQSRACADRAEDSADSLLPNFETVFRALLA